MMVGGSYFAGGFQFLRNKFFSRGYKLKSKVPRFTFQVFQGAHVVFFFVPVLADVNIVPPKLQHPIDEQRQLLRGRNDSFRRSQTPAHAPASGQAYNE